MRHEAGWQSPLLWAAMLAITFFAGLLVLTQALALRTLSIDTRALRMSADYSSDPRLVREVAIPPVNSEVISDTVRDIIAEQAQPPVQELLLTPTVVASPAPSRTATVVVTRRPSPTPNLANAPTVVVLSPTSTPTEPELPDQNGDVGPVPTRRQARTPTRTPTSPPTNTPPPTRTPTRIPTRTPTRTPTNTPTNTPLPTDTPTSTPTDTPTDTPTSTPTDTPLPTDTPTPTSLLPEVPTSPAEGQA